MEYVTNRDLLHSLYYVCARPSLPIWAGLVFFSGLFVFAATSLAHLQLAEAFKSHIVDRDRQG